MRNFILSATKICSFFNINLPDQNFGFTQKQKGNRTPNYGTSNLNG